MFHHRRVSHGPASDPARVVKFSIGRALSYPATRMHAAAWPGEISRNSGSIERQSSIAIGQRVRKRQPEGGLRAVGTSPFKIIRSRFSFGSGIGIAESSATVYGCNGFA